MGNKILIPMDRIEKAINLIRGMLDRWAPLQGAETKIINRAVKKKPWLQKIFTPNTELSARCTNYKRFAELRRC